MRFANRVLRRNLGDKILALVGGILLYAIAFAQQNPVQKANIYIEPKPTNIPPDLILRRGPDGSGVTVSGPTKSVEEFSALPTKAVVDLSRATAGVNRVPIRYETEGRGLQVTGPPFAEVRLEKKARMAFAVDVQHNETAPAGYDFQDPVATPARVTVSGLPDDVGNVARVVAFTGPDRGNPGSGEREVDADLVAQNIKRQAIDGVEIEPSSVKATLRLKKAPATKEVLLSANVQGNPAPGFEVVGYDFEPSMVTVSGTAAKLAPLSGVTIPLDASGLRKSVTRRLRVSLPAGVTLTRPTNAWVEASLDVRPSVLPKTQGSGTGEESRPPAVPATAPTPNTGPGTGSPEPSPSAAPSATPAPGLPAVKENL